MNLRKGYKKYINQRKGYLTLATMNHQRYVLERFVDSLSIESMENINCVKVQAYFDNLYKSGVSAITIKSRYAVIMAFLNHYYKEGILSFNPYFRIRKIRKQRTHRTPLNRKLLMKLINAECAYKLLPKFQHYRNKIIIGLLIFCGLRASEITNLKISGINIEEKYIKINNGKFNIDRIVPIEEPLVSWIREYLKVHPKKRSRYFIAGLSDKKKMDRNSITWIVRKTAKIAKIKRKVFSHLLRHSFASQMLEGRVDLNNLKLLMGHKSIEMTAMYAKPNSEMIREALLKNPLIKYF